MQNVDTARIDTVYQGQVATGAVLGMIPEDGVNSVFASFKVDE